MQFHYSKKTTISSLQSWRNQSQSENQGQGEKRWTEYKIRVENHLCMNCDEMINCHGLSYKMCLWKTNNTSRYVTLQEQFIPSKVKRWFSRTSGAFLCLDNRQWKNSHVRLLSSRWRRNQNRNTCLKGPGTRQPFVLNTTAAECQESDRRWCD